MRSSTITPVPPGSAWACRAGAGFTMSNTRKSTNATASTGIVSGSTSTESVMPATSSITIAPGSLLPSARSACPAAHVPITATKTKKSTSPARENGTNQSRRTVSALATVPGATGAKPAPPTVAMASATRVVADTGGVSRGATAPPGRPERLGGVGGHFGAPHLSESEVGVEEAGEAFAGRAHLLRLLRDALQGQRPVEREPREPAARRAHGEPRPGQADGTEQADPR